MPTAFDNVDAPASPDAVDQALGLPMGDALPPPISAFPPLLFAFDNPDAPDSPDAVDQVLAVPVLPTGNPQTLILPLPLTTPAVVTLTGPGYVQQGLIKAGPYMVAIGLSITPDGVLTPLDGLPHSDYVLTMTGIPQPVPKIMAGFAAATWPVDEDGEAGEVSAVVVVRGAETAASRYFTRIGSALTDNDANILYTGEYVYLPVTVLDPEDDNKAVDLMDAAVSAELALVRGSGPAEGDWVGAAVYADGGGHDGPVVGAALTGLRAPYGVYVRLTIGGQTVTRRAPGLLIVR